MGAWGTSLYANDCAGDIRGDYVDKLKRGKTNLEATRELLAENQEILADPEEAPLFWFALADTQWNYGRLLPEVKEKALLYLSREQEWERWKESGEKQLQAWAHPSRGAGLQVDWQPDSRPCICSSAAPAGTGVLFQRSDSPPRRQTGVFHYAPLHIPQSRSQGKSDLSGEYTRRGLNPPSRRKS